MKTTINKIGMFDLFKGVGILLVIWGHVDRQFFNPLPTVLWWANAVLSIAVLGALMPAFFIISGYSMRKRPVVKYLEQQKLLVLKPYLITAGITILLIFLRESILLDNRMQIIKGTAKAAIGFLLAVSPSGLRYLGLRDSTCGPLWFLAALVIGSTFFLWMLNTVDEKKHVWVVLAVSVVWGLITNDEDWVPFSLFRGLYAFCNIYVGYWMKKQKILSKPLSRIHWILGAVTFGIMMAVALWDGSNLLSAMVVCGYGGTYIAVLTVYLFTQWGNSNNWIANKLKYIGKNSLLFFCAHTVENMVLPWWKVGKLFQNSPVLGIIILVVVKLCICCAACWLILNRKNFWKKQES